MIQWRQSLLLMKAEPDSRVAFETTAEGDLKNTMTLFRVLHFANIIHFVPDGGRRCVSIVK